MNKVICGDALEVLKTFEDNSFHSMVTDPPAGISFMGKKWDKDRGGIGGFDLQRASRVRYCY